MGYALEDSQSKSSLVNSLSVCISLLDPKRSSVSSPLFHSFRTQHMYEPHIPVNPETIGAMLPKLSKWDLMLSFNICCQKFVCSIVHYPSFRFRCKTGYFKCYGTKSVNLLSTSHHQGFPFCRWVANAFECVIRWESIAYNIWRIETSAWEA